MPEITVGVCTNDAANFDSFTVDEHCTIHDFRLKLKHHYKDPTKRRIVDVRVFKNTVELRDAKKTLKQHSVENGDKLHVSYWHAKPTVADRMRHRKMLDILYMSQQTTEEELIQQGYTKTEKIYSNLDKPYVCYEKGNKTARQVTCGDQVIWTTAPYIRLV